MSAIDFDTIDLIPRTEPEHIRNRRFAIVRKGYDPDQVRAYLEQVAGWVSDLVAEVVAAEEGAATPLREDEDEEGADPYERLGARVAEILRAAEQHGEVSRREAEEQSERLLSAARGEAERIRQEAERLRHDAQAQAERIRREAQEEADQVRASAAEALARAKTEAEAMLAGLAGRRDLLLAELGSTRDRLVGIVDQLEQAVRDHGWEPGEAPLTEWPSADVGTKELGRLTGFDEADFDRLLEQTPTIDLILPDIPTFDDPDL